MIESQRRKRIAVTASAGVCRAFASICCRPRRLALRCCCRAAETTLQTRRRPASCARTQQRIESQTQTSAEFDDIRYYLAFVIVVVVGVGVRPCRCDRCCRSEHDKHTTSTRTNDSNTKNRSLSMRATLAAATLSRAATQTVRLHSRCSAAENAKENTNSQTVKQRDAVMTRQRVQQTGARKHLGTCLRTWR